MVAFKIKEVKNFMANLFQKNVFDQFLVVEAEVQTACSYKISGRRNKGFYSEEEFENLTSQEYLKWEELKLHIFQIIRGNKTPLLLSAVLSADSLLLGSILETSGSNLQKEDIAGAYMNIKYQAGELAIVTGTSLRSFALDKSFAQEWDRYVKRFLNEKEIVFDEL